MSEPDIPQPQVDAQNNATVDQATDTSHVDQVSEVNQQPAPADSAPVQTPQPAMQPADGSAEVPEQPAEPTQEPTTDAGVVQDTTQTEETTVSEDTQNGSETAYDPMSEWPEDVVRFTGVAYLISQRDGISPEEAAINLGNLLGSPDVIAEAQAAAAAQQEAQAAKAAAVNDTVSVISDKLTELQSLLSQ